MGKESVTTAGRVEADFAKAATQLKAEHAKEDAALKAEEAEKSAALKAEHAASGSKTGFIAKLTGHQDPVQKAESQHLKAEITRAEQQTKAAHTTEKAELDAAKAKQLASAQAADSLLNTHNNNAAGGAYNNNAAGGYNNNAAGGAYNNAAGGGAYNNSAGGAVLNNAGGSYAPSNYNAAPGAHINPNAYGSSTAAMAGPATDADKRVYNHATGTYGQAALDDGRRQDAEINPSRQNAQQQQQFVPQGIAAMPVVMGAQQPIMAQQPMMGAQQPMMGAQQPMMGAQQPVVMGAQQPVLGSQQQGHFSR